MAERLTPEQRHKNMAAIHGKDTRPEILVRKFLWSRGYRYRLNHPRLPGKPDIVLLRYRCCIFVNGCFWHGHGLPLVEVNSEKLIVNSWEAEEEVLDSTGVQSSQCIVHSSECCKIPKTNTEFWVKKIMRNKARDIEVQKKLAQMGWHCITIWECDLRPAKREETLRALDYTLSHIFLQDHSVHTLTSYPSAEDPELGMVAEELDLNEK